MDNELLNITISITLEDTEDGRLFVGKLEGHPDVETYACTPGEAYWLVVDVIRTLISSRNPDEIDR